VGKIIVLLVVAVQPAHAVGACEAQSHLDARHIRGMPKQRPPFAIGDSVMLGAAESLAHAGIKVNARGCRQWGDGLDILAKRKRKHRLPRVVIVELGTNWVVTRADTRRALRILDPGQKLVLVTPRTSADTGDARLMRRVARNHPHRVCLADWRRRSAGHSEWAPGDGIHLSASGIAAFTRLLKPYRRVTARRPGPCGGSSGSRRSRPRSY
jgi:lysophospholipase L1-like esterase